MNNKSLLHTFYLSVLILSFILFGFHLLILYALRVPLFDNMIIWAYLVNMIMALGIFSVLYFFRSKWKDQLGFLYLAGSMLKFVVFFIVFYPVYKLDGNMAGLEFSTFFVPYLLALILETIFTAKMLNSLDR